MHCDATRHYQNLRNNVRTSHRALNNRALNNRASHPRVGG